MLRFGLTENKALEPDWFEVTPVEKAAAVRVLERNSNICISYTSEKQEAPQFIEDRKSQSQAEAFVAFKSFRVFKVFLSY
jgi:hypothetical protein